MFPEKSGQKTTTIDEEKSDLIENLQNFYKFLAHIRKIDDTDFNDAEIHWLANVLVNPQNPQAGLDNLISSNIFSSEECLNNWLERPDLEDVEELFDEDDEDNDDMENKLGATDGGLPGGLEDNYMDVDMENMEGEQVGNMISFFFRRNGEWERDVEDMG